MNEVIEKLNLKQLGFHISNFINLYYKPIKKWREALSNRSSGYTLVISHVVYYTLIAYLILNNTLDAIKGVILELSTTLFPFLIFLIPFKIFTKRYNKKLTSKHLFRFLIILRLQLLPIILIILLIEDSTKIEGLFILSNNLVWIFWILCVITVPLLLILKKMQKVYWITTNYIFLNLVFLLSSFIPINFSTKTLETAYENSKELDSLYKLKTVIKADTTKTGKFKLSSFDNPDFEYASFKIYTIAPPLMDDYYFAVVKGDTLNGFSIKPQFLSPRLFGLFRNAIYNGKDSVGPNDTIINYDLNRSKFNLAILDSHKIEFTQFFYEYKRNVEILSKTSIFESNRNYFEALDQYLSLYEQMHSKFSLIDTIMLNSKVLGFISMEDSSCAILYQINSKRDFYNEKELEKIEKEFEERHVANDFFMRIALFPSRYARFLFGDK